MVTNTKNCHKVNNCKQQQKRLNIFLSDRQKKSRELAALAVADKQQQAAAAALVKAEY